jgi:hypothetical protein
MEICNCSWHELRMGLLNLVTWLLTQFRKMRGMSAVAQ